MFRLQVTQKVQQGGPVWVITEMGRCGIYPRKNERQTIAEGSEVDSRQ